MPRAIAKLAVGLPLAALSFFACLIALLALFQRSLIYPIPATDTSTPPGFERIAYETSDGLTLNAGYRAAKGRRPTLLFFHGNGVGWQSTYHTTDLLAEQGYGVLAAEYRGYGGNPSRPSEQGLYRDGRAALDWLAGRDVMPSDIVLVGNSLGSGVAVELAGQVDALALVLVAPFMSLGATASNAYPWAPVDLLLRDRFDNIGKIGEIETPILIIHGENDGLIPVAHAMELSAASDHAQLVLLPGYGHNMSGEDAAQLPQLEFLERLAVPAP